MSDNTDTQRKYDEEIDKYWSNAVYLSGININEIPGVPKNGLPNYNSNKKPLVYNTTISKS